MTTAALEIVDAEIVESDKVFLTFEQARAATDSIKGKLKRIAGDIAEVQLDIATFYMNDGWEALGYTTWDEFVIVELKVQIKLPVADRKSLAQVYRKSGMSQAAIAQVLGVTKMTVHNDLKSSVKNYTEDAESADTEQVTKTRDGKVIDKAHPKRFTCVSCNHRRDYEGRVEMDDGSFYCESCFEALDEAKPELAQPTSRLDASDAEEHSDSHTERPAKSTTASRRIEKLQTEVHTLSAQIPWTSETLDLITTALDEINELSAEL